MRKKRVGLVAMTDRYGDITATHVSAILDSQRLIDRYVVPLFPEKNVLIVGDMATADGHNSFPLFSALHRSRPIEVHYSDFSADNRRKVTHTMTVLEPDYRWHYSHGSFHGQVYPTHNHSTAESPACDVIFSSTATHWLSEELESDATVYGPAGNHAEAYVDLAAHDWENIIDSREKELPVGGLMVFANIATLDTGEYIAEAIYTAMQAAADLMDISFTMPLKYRTKDEHEAPVLKRGNLQILHSEIKTIDCPYYAEYLRQTSLRNPNTDRSDLALEYGRKIADSTRAWAYSSVLKACQGDTEKAHHFFQIVAKVIATNPDEFQFPFHMHYMVVKKTSA